MAVDESAELQMLVMMDDKVPDDQVEEELAKLTESGSYGRVSSSRPTPRPGRRCATRHS